MGEAASAPSRGQLRPRPPASGASVRSHKAAVRPQATMAMARATKPSTRRRRCVLRAPWPSSQNGSRRERLDHAVPPWGSCRSRRPRRRSADRRAIIASRSPVDQPDDGTSDRAPNGSAPAAMAAPTLAEGRDDVAPVGLELGLLVAVHEVEVELVDAGIGELAQLGDVVLGRTRARRTGRSPRRRRTPRWTSRPRRGGGSRSPSRSRM